MFFLLGAYLWFERPYCAIWGILNGLLKIMDYEDFPPKKTKKNKKERKEKKRKKSTKRKKEIVIIIVINSEGFEVSDRLLP